MMRFLFIMLSFAALSFAYDLQYHPFLLQVKDKYGVTALDMAKNEAIKQLLRQHGAKSGRELQ